MFKKAEIQENKYKVLLVAYKGLEAEMENELLYHFISIVRNGDEIRESMSSNDKNLAGLSFRTGLYHTWFKNTMKEKLDEGYKLGIVEMPKSYGDGEEHKLKELHDKFGDLIEIVEVVEL